MEETGADESEGGAARLVLSISVCTDVPLGWDDSFVDIGKFVFDDGSFEFGLADVCTALVAIEWLEFISSIVWI